MVGLHTSQINFGVNQFNNIFKTLFFVPFLPLIIILSTIFSSSTIISESLTRKSEDEQT